MYEYVNDVLRAKRINPEDVELIRHTDSRDDKEHWFRKAQEAGYIKEYTAMQRVGFAKSREYLMVFIGEKHEKANNAARFYAFYRITNRFITRADHVPVDYPNKKELKKEGFIELVDEPIPQDIEGFVIDWGKAAAAWHQRATIEKPIIEITE